MEVFQSFLVMQGSFTKSCSLDASQQTLMSSVLNATRVLGFSKLPNDAAKFENHCPKLMVLNSGWILESFEMFKNNNKGYLGPTSCWKGPLRGSPSLPHPWTVCFVHWSTAGAVFKDAALREQCVVATIWVACMTES